MNRLIHRIATFLILGTIACFVYAQSADEQILIFRNTGETNLLWQSQLDSITTTNRDTVGNVYDEPYAQIFYSGKDSLYVPLAEMDSVCFGSRNAIEFNTDVRILEENPDMQWIIRYDGNNIYYKAETPSNVLPIEGQKLYYTEQTELFPCGLCARVDKVVHEGTEIIVTVSSIDLKDVFKRFFYAGSIDNLESEMAKAHRAHEFDKGATLQSSMEIGDYGELAVDGRIGIHGKVVLHPFKNYYHALIELENVLGFSLKATARESAEYNLEHNFLHIPLPTVAAAFQPSIDVDLFVDMNAELAFEYAMDRKVTTRIEWTRRGDDQVFTRQNPTEDGAQGNTAKMQVTLNGSIYAGLQTAFHFALVGDIVGATAKMKYGVEFSGQLGIGLLNNLRRSYDVSAYGRAELGLASKLKFEGYTTRRSGWIWGDVLENKILDYEHVFAERRIDLFPRFFAPRATTTPKRKDVTVAVKSDNEIAHKVESGFELLKSKEDPQPVDSIFVKEIEVKKEVQGIDAEFVLPTSIANADSVVLRPVFHYAGFTIPHDVITAIQDPNIQPVVFSMANGGCTLVSGVPFAGNVTIDSTMYVIGPYVPIPHNDTVFHKVSPYAGMSEGYVYYEDAENLIGTWTGTLDGEDIRITFTEDGSCSYHCVENSISNGTYRVNEPQSGCVLIESSDKCVILGIEAITSNLLSVRFKNTKHKGKQCQLQKQR